MNFFAVRRARVRPEFASLYPEMVPGVWISAAKAARLGRRADPHERRVHGCPCARLLCEIHFEFRGGASHQERIAGWKSRAGYGGPSAELSQRAPTRSSSSVEQDPSLAGVTKGRCE